MKKILLMTFIMIMLTANIAFGISIVDVACGENHTVLLAEDGTVWTMGDNSNGQCGPTNVGNYIDKPTQILYIPRMQKIAAAGNRTMLLDVDGIAYELDSNGILKSIGIKNVVDIKMGFIQCKNLVMGSMEYGFSNYGLVYAVLTEDGLVYTKGYIGDLNRQSRSVDKVTWFNVKIGHSERYVIGYTIDAKYFYTGWGIVYEKGTTKLKNIKEITLSSSGLQCMDNEGYTYSPSNNQSTTDSLTSYTYMTKSTDKIESEVQKEQWRTGLSFTGNTIQTDLGSLLVSDILHLSSNSYNVTSDGYDMGVECGGTVEGKDIILTVDGKLYEANESEYVRNYNIAGKRIVKAASGGKHTILLDESGNAYAYGNNVYGQLGLKKEMQEKIELLMPGTYYKSDNGIGTYLTGLLRKGNLVKNLDTFFYNYNGENTIDLAAEFGLSSVSEGVKVPTLIESLQEIVPSGQSSLAYMTSDARVWIGGIVNFSLMFEVGEDMTLRNTGNNLQDIFTNGALNIKVYDWNKVNGQDVQITSAQGLVYNVYENGVNITQTITPNFVFKRGKVYQLECGIGGADVFVERGKTYTIKFEGMNASKVKDGVVTQMRSAVDIAKFVLRVYVTELANLT